MKFHEWFNSEPHRAKYSSDHPAYLAAQEAWESAHEACAKVCDSLEEQCEKLLVPDEKWPTPADCANIIRARGQA